MSDTQSNTPVATLPIRAISRNGTSLTPILATIKRGEAKGVAYPTIKVTKDNIQDVISFYGFDKVVDMLQGKINQDFQATLDYCLNKHELWITTPKVDPETGHAVKDPKTGDVLIHTRKYDPSAVPVDDLYSLLEKGAIRGGVTIKSLKAENEDLKEELYALMKQITTDPMAGVRAAEIAQRMQDNEEEMNRISESRKKSLADSEDSDE